MEQAEQYVEQLLSDDADLERAQRGIAAAGMPAISIAPGFGQLLTMLVKISGAQQLLEVGALGGISGICLARGLREGGQLTSLEIEQRFADVARAHVEAAGLGDKVAYMVGDARASLAELERQGRKFDFFFIDADKGGYPAYLDYALRLANPGAIIAGDNTLLRGRVCDPGNSAPSVVAMRAFNEAIAGNERLISTLLPAYDGLTLAVVK